MRSALLIVSATLVVAVCFAALVQDKPDAPAEPEIKLPTKAVELADKKPQAVTLKASEGHLALFKFKVPAGAKSLHIVAADATADIDLIVSSAQFKNFDELEDAEHVASTGRFNETLVIDADSDPALKAGDWFIYAGSLQAEGEDELSFTLIASLNGPPELKKTPLPPFRTGTLSPQQRAIDACVRLDNGVSTGSATVITPGGLALTCFHVIANEEGDKPAEDPIFVSFTLDVRKDPVQACRASIVHADKALDLALLRIDADLDGKPLSGVSFTHAPLGDPGKLSLDEELRCLGFPGIGGSRSVYGVTLTRGVVSGFVERKGALSWIKTDTLISSGNSGGSAFNARYELVGVPTEQLYEEDTYNSLGYLRPVSAMPDAWKKLVKDGLK